MNSSTKPISIALGLAVFLSILLLASNVAAWFYVPLPSTGPHSTRPLFPPTAEITSCPQPYCPGSLDGTCAANCNYDYIITMQNVENTYTSCMATASTNHTNALQNCASQAGCQWVNQEIWCPSGTHQLFYESCAETALNNKLTAETGCVNDYDQGAGQAQNQYCICFGGCIVAGGGCPEFVAP